MDYVEICEHRRNEIEEIKKNMQGGASSPRKEEKNEVNVQQQQPIRLKAENFDSVSKEEQGKGRDKKKKKGCC